MRKNFFKRTCHNFDVSFLKQKRLIQKILDLELTLSSIIEMSFYERRIINMS